MKPLFITGVQRTGTTLLTEILDTHQNISITIEQNVLQIWHDLIYKELVEKVESLSTSTDREFYKANRLEILVRVTALTDAAAHDVITRPEAVRMLEAYVQSLKEKKKKAIDF